MGTLLATARSARWRSLRRLCRARTRERRGLHSLPLRRRLDCGDGRAGDIDPSGACLSVRGLLPASGVGSWLRCGTGCGRCCGCCGIGRSRWRVRRRWLCWAGAGSAAAAVGGSAGWPSLAVAVVVVTWSVRCAAGWWRGRGVRWCGTGCGCASRSSSASATRAHPGCLPLILVARPTPAGERVWVWLRPGLDLSDLDGKTGKLAVACWAGEVRVVRASARYAALIRVDITRRDPLTGLVRSPLARLGSRVARIRRRCRRPGRRWRWICPTCRRRCPSRVPPAADRFRRARTCSPGVCGGRQTWRPVQRSSNESRSEPDMANDTTMTVVGNLTADPDLRFTPAGVALAKFTVASTPRVLDRHRASTATAIRCS